MDNFAIIYRILKVLEKGMDYEVIDVSAISSERLGITRERWEKIIIMIVRSGYVEGVVYDQSFADYGPRIVEPIQTVITLKGLEYLAENTLMKKAANIAKGIKEVIPGL